MLRKILVFTIINLIVSLSLISTRVYADLIDIKSGNWSPASPSRCNVSNDLLCNNPEVVTVGAIIIVVSAISFIVLYRIRKKQRK